jgi:hypothetical protein
MREILALEEDANALAATRLREACGFVGRRGPAHVVLQQPRELVAERRVRARGEKSLGQLLDRRNERLRHEAPAVGAEVAARIRIAPAKNGSQSIRVNFGHGVTIRANADRAFIRKRATFSRSFTPGADSTPEATSTPIGRTVMMASSMFSGVSPPARTTLR